MRAAVFSTKPYDRTTFQAANERFGHDLVFFEHRLTRETTALARGFEAVCAFVNDDLGERVLADLAEAGLPLAAEPFRAIWRWRFPPLLHWQGDDPGEHMSLLPAPEPWPLICDTPREGGFTSRFVDASLQRFEVQSSAALRRRCRLLLNGRPLPLGEAPLAVRYRQHRLYPCLHPGIAPSPPLVLQLLSGELTLAQWSLETAEGGWQPQAPSRVTAAPAAAWRAQEPGLCTLDLRLEPEPHP